MISAETRYPDMEKLVLSLLMAARKLKPYFQAHVVTVLTNYPLRQILLKPEASGRLMRWALELSQYTIQFAPRVAMKGQAVADFVAEFTPFENSEEIEYDTWQSEDASHWTLYVDGSSNQAGSGAGLILISPEPERAELNYALRFQFKASNNEAEYEALIAGLRLAKTLNVQHLIINSDSQLIVCQVTSQYNAKEPRMSQYYQVVHNLLAQFVSWKIIQIPRAQNSKADALARLASSTVTDLKRSIPVEFLEKPSIAIQEQVVNQVHVSAETNWMTPFIDYLSSTHIPDGNSPEERKLKRKALQYVLINGMLYKKAYTMPYLKCLSPEEATSVLQEVHEGVCGNHSAGRSLMHRILTQGYYWPTIAKDSKEFSKCCDKCQRFATVPRLPPENLTSITSPWPFSQWGVDLIGPLPPARSQLRFAIVAVDYFTKWAEAEPLATITEAKTTNFIWKNIICRFGVPHAIVSDNGKQFDNARFRDFCAELGIKNFFSSPGHPQANGQVEAVNKIIKKNIKTKLENHKGAWADELPQVLWAYRTTARNSTGETPFSLTFGTEAVLPVDMEVPSYRTSDRQSVV